EAAASDAGPLLAHAGRDRLADLAAGVGEEGERGADRVGRVGEVGEVSGAGAVLPAAAPGGYGQHEGLLVGAAAEEVAAAGTVQGEQSPVGGALDGTALEFGGAGRPVADHHLPAVLLVPAEGGDVEGGAVQDAQLAGAGLAGPVGAPRGEPVGGVQPGRH